MRVLTFVAAAFLAACSSGSDGGGEPAAAAPPPPAPPPPPPPPALVALPLPDAALKQCVLTTAAANALSQPSDFTTLTCAGVGDLSGIDALSKLRDVDLRDGSFQSLTPLAGITSLERVDLRGVDGLYCDDIDSLIAARPTATVLAEDMCRGAVVFDFGWRPVPPEAALDTARGRVYVSVGERDIVVLPLTDVALAERIPLPGLAYAIDLSIDGTRLFVVLNDGSPSIVGNDSLAVVDLATRNVRTIAPAFWQGTGIGDVVEAEPGRLFVTATKSGKTFVAQVRLDQNEAVSVAAEYADMGFGPGSPGRLLVSPTRDFVYAGDNEGFLYKLSLADPNARIVLQRRVGGHDSHPLYNAVLNEAGTLLVTGEGHALRTSSFEEHGRLTLPMPAFNVTPTKVNAAAQASNGLWAPRSTKVLGGATTQWETTEPIDFYSLDTLARTRSVETRCGIVGAIHPYNADRDFVVAGKGFPDYITKVCIAASFPRSMPRDRLGLFQDPALQNCVSAEARRRGFTRAEQFITLDCSDVIEPIRTLRGIERLTNLEHLDISGSAPYGPALTGQEHNFLPQLDRLRSFTAVGSGLRDISTLFDLPLLTTANLDGNPDLSCTQLDELAARRVAVIADHCTDRRRLRFNASATDLALSHDRTRAYVTVQAWIHEVDLVTVSIARSWYFGGVDLGRIKLSADGDTLFVTRGYALGYVDLATGQLETVDLRNELGASAYDVIETAPDRLLVSAHGGMTGGGFVVLVQRDLGNAASRVANGTFFQGSPRFAAGGDRSSVVMVAGAETSRIFRLDATQADVPIAAERPGAGIFLQKLSSAPDGSRVYFNGGIIDAATLATLGGLPGQMVSPSPDGARLYVVEQVPVEPLDFRLDRAGIYDADTLTRIGERTWGCGMDFYPVVLEESLDWLIALNGDLCVARVVPY